MTAQVLLAHPPLKANRTFHWILTGQLISILGDGFHSVAANLWVLQTTGSAKAMSLVLGTRILIAILFGTVAGTVVDRVDRRRLMWRMDLALGLVGLASPFLKGLRRYN